MYISQQLRKQNIAEYLLYMWQVEDILRAFDVNLTRIRKEYVPRFEYDDQQIEDLTDWFGNLINMMNSEGKREKGHLAINEAVMKQLIDLHLALSNSTKFPFYTAQYYKVLPFIVELRTKNGNGDSTENEIETCFNALYGAMMLRLQGRTMSPETKHAIDEIATFIGMLSDYYKQDRDEGLIFEEE